MVERSTVIKGVIGVSLFLVVYLTIGRPVLNGMEQGLALTQSGQSQEYIGSNPPDVGTTTQNYNQVPTDALNKPGIEVDTKYYGDVPSADRTKPIEKIVLHHTGGSTASGAISGLKERKLSVHYVIDKNGVIYFLVSEAREAFHCGCCWPSQPACCGKESCFVCITDDPVADNHDSIGIEIVNTGAASDPYTKAQYDSLNLLIKDINSRRNTILIDNNHIVAHYQISPEKWDPSPNFDWSQIGLETPRPPGNLPIPVPKSAGYP